MQCLVQLLRANYIELCRASVSFLFAYIIQVQLSKYNNKNYNNKYIIILSLNRQRTKEPKKIIILMTIIY